VDCALAKAAPETPKKIKATSGLAHRQKTHQTLDQH
jgi:hypothetical protein